jgi:hypothetical protein
MREWRRRAEDGRDVVVERHDNGLWFVRIEGGVRAHEFSGGDSLDSGMIAEVLGYDIVHDEYPDWIDAWANEIKPGAGDWAKDL